MENNSNDSFALASRLINHSNKNIFLTGKAGTGKTTFLKYIQENTHKKTVVVAPTGIAAINAGGVTIHSFFQLPFGSFVPDKNQNHTRFTTPATLFKNLHIAGVKRKIMLDLELLIIDEVSMCRADILDEIDLVLRFIRRKSTVPFGGVQVLFIGDLLQLPPIVKDEEWTVLKNYYKSAYFFDAQVLQKEKPVFIELEKVYRQEDETFIHLLNNLRHNTVSENDIKLLNQHYKPQHVSTDSDNIITITTHNYKADKINKEHLDSLSGHAFVFNAEVHGEFSEMAYPIEKELELKKGAQIMFIKNDAQGKRFFNGKIAKVFSVDKKEIKIQFDDSTELLTLEKQIWENTKYTINETTNEIVEKVVGTFTHYPIKLAWAITVHKSQGLTFDKAIIDIGSAFAAGQAYVALSRLRSLNGLILTSRLNENAIDYDKNIAEFSSIKASAESLKTLAKQEGELYFKEYLNKSFDLKNLNRILKAHIETYDKDENKSNKQQYVNWAIQLKEILEKELTHSEKFILYVNGVLEKKENNFLETLYQRAVAAEGYFSPLVKKLSAKILQHIELVKTEKKNKQYLKELLELETECNEQIKNFNKALAIANSMLNNSEFSKNDIQHLNQDIEREKQIHDALKTNAYVAAKTKEKSVKTDKIDTRELTYNLYKQGKKIEEIAKERNFATTTIEGHLAQLVRDGKLNAEDFISKEKAKEIRDLAFQMKTMQMGAIKAAVGDKYSYTELRFGLATIK